MNIPRESSVSPANDPLLEKNGSVVHPAESSENTSICAKIRKYIPIDCLWRMFSQPHFEKGAIKIHVISINRVKVYQFILSKLLEMAASAS